MNQNDREAPTTDHPDYGRPEVTDFGTLLDLTEAGHVSNADSPAGNSNSAYPSLH